MFIYTLKASSIKFFIVLLLSVAVLVTLVSTVPRYENTGEVAVVTTNYSGVKTEDDRIRFISDFGYTVDSSSESRSVVIPEEFDAVFSKYNDLQRAQGLNLKKYQGKSVMRYSYYVNNYKGYDGKVVITLLVYKDRIIGGDVCGLDNAGFLHGFEKATV